MASTKHAGMVIAGGLLTVALWLGGTPAVAAQEAAADGAAGETVYHQVVSALGATKTMTLAEAIDAALENHVQVHLKKWEWEEAQVRLEQARAADLMQPDPVRTLQAEAGVEIAEQQVEQARLLAAKDAEADYYNVLRLRHLLQMLEEAVAVARRQEEIARQRLAVGAATRRDLLSAQAEVVRIEQQQASLAEGLAVALTKFQQTVGVPGAVPALIDVQAQGFDFDVERAVAEAMERRIELVQLETGVAAAEKALQLASNDYTAGLTREAARLQLEIRRQQLRQGKAGIELEVRSAYQKMLEQRGRIKVTEAKLAETEEWVRVMEAMFHADMVTQVELMESLTGLTAARSDAIEARFDARLAEADFFRAMGWTLAEREAWEKGLRQREEG